MKRTSSALQGMLIGWLFLLVVIGGMALVGLSQLTGLTIRELLPHTQTLLIAPMLFFFVWVIEHFDVPLPFRVENTWPIILGAAWIGIHTLIVIKAGNLGADSSAFYSENWDDLPWYAGNACRWVVFSAFVVGGYLVRNNRNSIH